MRIPGWSVGIVIAGGAVVVWAFERFIAGAAWDLTVVNALVWAGVVLGLSALGKPRAAGHPPSPACGILLVGLL